MKPPTVTLGWHLAHLLLAIAGLVGNLAYRKHYAATKEHR